MKNTIKPGDTVILGSQNGLGRGRFLVLEVVSGERIYNLRVQGRNGQTWWARPEGAKVV